MKKKPYVLKKDILMGDIIKNSPKAAQLLAEYGLLCINCPLNQFETLEQGAKKHGMSGQKIKKMIKDINNQL